MYKDDSGQVWRELAEDLDDEGRMDELQCGAVSSNKLDAHDIDRRHAQELT